MREREKEPCSDCKCNGGGAVQSGKAPETAGCLSLFSPFSFPLTGIIPSPLSSLSSFSLSPTPAFAAFLAKTTKICRSPSSGVANGSYIPFSAPDTPRPYRAPFHPSPHTPHSHFHLPSLTPDPHTHTQPPDSPSITRYQTFYSPTDSFRAHTPCP